MRELTAAEAFRRGYAAGWCARPSGNYAPTECRDYPQTPPWPKCDDHREVQHRDRKPPWCNTCGWSRGRPASGPFQGRQS